MSRAYRAEQARTERLLKRARGEDENVIEWTRDSFTRPWNN